jgi:hypothetical protein
MAPRRWAPKTRAIIIDALTARDGPTCAICHAKPTLPLEVDHRDPTGPATFANLRLLCKGCNLARRRKPVGSKDRGINVRERERETERQLTLKEAPSPTDQAKQAIPYANGSPEMAASTYFEINYRSWVITNAPMLKTDAINAGAEVVGCSIETAERYLRKLTSTAGPLKSVQDAQGTNTIHRRL